MISQTSVYASQPMILHHCVVSSKRLLAIVYLILLYIVLSTIFIYLFRSFVIFCVIYTLQDGYKKRRRFMWVIQFVVRNTQLVVYALIGEELYHSWFGMKHPKKFKKKI